MRASIFAILLGVSAGFSSQLFGAELVVQPPVAELREQLQSHIAEPTSQSAFAVGACIRNLRQLGVSEAAIQDARQICALPNFFGTVGSEMVKSKELDEPVVNSQAVSDYILGASITGQARTTGRASLRLLPSDECAMFEITLRGKTRSTTRGVSGPAIVHSTGNADFTVTARVRIDAAGQTSDPPKATAALSTSTNDIVVPRLLFPGLGDGRRHFVERIAWKKAGQLKPQADAIAQQRAARRYEQSMAEYVGKALEKTNKPYQEKVLGTLKESGAMFESARFSSSERAIFLNMLYADKSELGADSPRPKFTREHSLGFGLHESLLRNIGQMVLRNATFTDRELARWMKTALGEIPREAREFRLGTHLQPWNVKLAADRPLFADFGDGQATLGVRTAELTIDGKTYPAKMRIEATYQINFTPHGPQLVRIGDVTLKPDVSEIIAPSTEVQSFLERKVKAFFLSEIWFDGLVPPAGGALDRFAQLGFDELIVENGWICLGFGLSPTSVPNTNRVVRR